MLQLLFTVIFAEMAVIIVLCFKTPLRKLVLMVLDRAKRGRGPVIVKTVGGTVSVVMLSYIFSMMMLKKRWIVDGNASLTDEILMAKNLLETTLMGGLLFLSLIIDKLHHYIKELRIRRKTMETAKKQGQGFEDAGGSDKVTALEEEIATLRARIKQLESD
ncbi:hypothetical protein CXB51_013835 [Gossypium anomalum]|uniref:Endoplasmic reticulum transmembrane protein n=15 Tax=Gossypium TaxID=3633 RepID=A0A1U8IUD5_GOSHI|nr:uncharacterized protein LOC105774155 [Gossypium raimondii]XP_016681727.1 uncharacterized protein LOC107900583 [Gossypium hirsutum]XP_016753702.1 uncharacterized protein LOC107962006 [Gossypium hirsutum]XP_017645037.1 uncharacterized protein LOC108485696 [Gossypium arboreum]KAA3478168.1 B-cell receptor-associated 31-like [Gossypium australe]KAB2078435.1 hypothetical protein ES319_A06G162500v1 [Gossypium barbadense]KAG8490604.1 hypothetical protein CXB51_013835 [Gossypium anomalum]MBA062708